LPAPEVSREATSVAPPVESSTAAAVDGEMSGLDAPSGSENNAPAVVQITEQVADVPAKEATQEATQEGDEIMGPVPVSPQPQKLQKPRTGLSKLQIRSGIRKQRAALQACVKAHGGGMVPRFVVDVTVFPTGRVRSVKGDRLSELTRCGIDAVEQMSFPATRDGGSASVTILPLGRR
ncbi:MAG: hypothetical protein ACPG77_10985, partial [Nannocystaceae bacterium]